LRRVLGACRADILRQFMVEARMLSLSGGVIGILAGIGATVVVAWAAVWETVIDAPALLLAVAASAGIGLLFGAVPARKASLASPVGSLRAE